MHRSQFQISLFKSPCYGGNLLLLSTSLRGNTLKFLLLQTCQIFESCGSVRKSESFLSRWVSKLGGKKNSHWYRCHHHLLLNLAIYWVRLGIPKKHVFIICYHFVGDVPSPTYTCWCGRVFLCGGGVFVVCGLLWRNFFQYFQREIRKFYTFCQKCC